jgi:4-amino-4-deoxy-L-arabinose transferase-like glycosyltransferase
MAQALALRARRLDARWWLALVLAGYLACSLLIPHLGGKPDDETAYLQYAERLTHGDYADSSQADQYLWRGPGLPLLLAPFAAVDAPVGIPRLIPPLALFAAVLLFYRLLRFQLREGAALAGALALGLYYPFARSLGFVYTEPVSIFLVVLALYLWVRRRNGGGIGSLVGVGLALGALSLTRVEYGYVITVCLLIAGAVWALRRSSIARDATAICGVALALCIPWLAYTYSLTDKAFYWSNAGSLSLYWMTSTNPDDLGDPHTQDDVFEDQDLAPHRPLFTRLRAMEPVAADEELRRVARRQIDEHPERFASNLVNNTSRLLFNFPFSFKNQSAAPLFYMLPNVLLLVALGLALWVLAGERRLWGLMMAPAVFGLLGFAIHVPVAGYPRYVFPIVPLCVWVAVVGICFSSPRLRASSLSAGHPER